LSCCLDLPHSYKLNLHLLSFCLANICLEITVYRYFVTAFHILQSITSPRFSFFDREILKDPELEGHNFDKFKVCIDVVLSS